MARVLVVDDQRLSRAALERTLGEAGQQVAAAASGEEGLRLAREWAPDVVVLDLNMPGMDGFQVVERLKRDPETAHVPVVFLTAEPPTDELVVRGLDLGAYDFLSKGGSNAELVARVAAMARIKRGYDELSALARISASLIRTVEPLELMQVFVEQAREVFRADAVLLALRRPGRRTDLTAGAGVDTGDPLCEQFTEALLAILGARSGEASLFEAEELTGPAGAWLRREGFRNLVATYVGRGARPPTVLVALSRKPGAFRTDSDPTLLRSLAQQATIALDNALLHAETRRQAAKLREQARQLERAMSERSRFFASMSHEIRTPINAVIGYNQLLEEGLFGPLEERQRQAVENVSRAAQHLLELINDILDISKIEAGKFEVARTDVDLAELLRDTATSLRLQAQEKDLEFTIEAPRRLVVRTDGARVRQILLNLLSNAVKFTDRGSVSAVLEPPDEARPASPVRICVRDTGRGIAPEHRERIFDEFEQVEGGSPRGGTGLGLSISRKLAELLGGTLRVQSEVGEGSTFILELPADLGSGVSAQPAGVTGSEGGPTSG